MLILLYFFIFFLGISVGSFLNCVIYRLEKEKSFTRGRSFCPHCKHQLSWQDLIPLLSFIFLRGKCRYCQKAISWQYPLVEIATGALLLLIFNFKFLISDQFLISNFLNLFYYWIIASFLIIIFVYDLKHYIIPDEVVFPAIAIAGIFNLQFLILNQPSIFKFSILSAFGAAAFFLAFVLITKGKGMGGGDVKLAFLMGLVLGWPNILVALFSSSLIGVIIGISMVILGKKKLKSAIPFGPFLVVGTFIALFWGLTLTKTFFNLINQVLISVI